MCGAALYILAWRWCHDTWATAEGQNRWCAKAGVYHVYLGFNSEELPLHSTFELKKTFGWSGL